VGAPTTTDKPAGAETVWRGSADRFIRPGKQLRLYVVPANGAGSAERHGRRAPRCSELVRSRTLEADSPSTSMTSPQGQHGQHPENAQAPLS